MKKENEEKHFQLLKQHTMLRASIDYTFYYPRSPKNVVEENMRLRKEIQKLEEQMEELEKEN